MTTNPVRVPESVHSEVLAAARVLGCKWRMAGAGMALFSPEPGVRRGLRASPEGLLGGRYQRRCVPTFRAVHRPSKTTGRNVMALRREDTT